MYRACRSITNHLARTAREVYGWFGSSLPTDVSLIGQVAPKTELHVDCPMAVQSMSSKSEWDDTPNAGWVREVGIAFTGYHVVRYVECALLPHNPRACKGFRDDIIAALRL